VQQQQQQQQQPLRDMRETCAKGLLGGDRQTQHTGSLFVALPDGTALVVPLAGVSQPPKSAKLGTREGPCKQWRTERLPVSNWLPLVQRFRVQLVRGGKADAATALRGPEFFEVPALGTAEYPLEVFAHREGTVNVELIAMNEATGEFCVAEVALKCTAPGVLETLALQTRVRQSVAQTILLSNPLPQAVTMSMTCHFGALLGDDGNPLPVVTTAGPVRGGNAAAASAAAAATTAATSSAAAAAGSTAAGVSGTMGGGGGGKPVVYTEVQGPPTVKLPARCVDLAYAFEYLPLFPRSVEARLTLSSVELGTNIYTLRLQALPAAPLPVRVFSAALGDTVTQRHRLVHFSPARNDMVVTCSDKDFSAPATVNAAPAVKTGSELFFDVTFEPSKLGEVHATLTVTSANGGEYVCPLVGRGLPPSPAGPFTVRAGGKFQLPFKNVLPSTETFAITVDNAAFTVKDKETLKSGETKEIVIKHEGSKDGSTGGARALLSITCVSGPLAGTTWPHYLVTVAQA
jgi:hydrocephalus-inducing protein